MSVHSMYKEGDLIPVPGNAFLVVKILGIGGMGTVYLAVDKKLDEQQALKVLHPELARTRPDIITRFEREARALTKVKHPNITRVIALYNLVDENGTPAYSMEALEGVSIADSIGKGTEEPHRALNVLYQILAGLDAMHRRGLVHRDVKPPNLILYKEDGRIEWLLKILDFGVIRIMADETQPSGFIGTFAYASDRQLRGKLAEPMDDVWAAFMVLYELLTGAHAFAEFGLGRDGALARIGKKPRELRDHGLDLPDLQALLDKALHPNPSERFSDAFTALKAIKPLQQTYAASFQGPRKPSTTQDRERAPEQITEAHLSPTKPDVLPDWLVQLRAQHADPAPASIAIRAGDSVVDERAPTTPAPLRRVGTVDERLSARSTMQSPKAVEAKVHGGATIEERDPSARVVVVPSEPQPDPRGLPTKLPSETPPAPEAGDVEYVPSSNAGRRRLPDEKERSPGPKLFLLVRAHDGVEHGSFLLEEYPVVLGREAPATLIVPHGRVSAQHARIDFVDGKFLLTDLESTNGTFILRAKKRLKLEPRIAIELTQSAEEIHVGPVTMAVVLGTKVSPERLAEIIERDRERLLAMRRLERLPSSGDREPSPSRTTLSYPWIAVGFIGFLLIGLAAFWAWRSP